MKKAFDDNLPRVKPRVRFGTAAAEVTVEADGAGPARTETSADELEPGEDLRAAVSSAAQAALRDETTSFGGLSAPDPFTAPRAARPEPSPAVERPPPPAEKTTGSLFGLGAEGSAGDARRRRLRARLLSLQPNEPSTGQAGRPPEAVVAAAEVLTRELGEARTRADRLEHELARARADLARVVAEAEAERQRVEAQGVHLAEARQLLGSLEAELSMLEEERDEVLAEVRTLRQADEARRDSLSAMSLELDAAREGLTQAHAEQAEVVRELEVSDLENGRLSQEVARLTAERGRLLEQLTELAGTKGELADSKRTLERVHKLLAVAAAPAKR